MTVCLDLCGSRTASRAGVALATLLILAAASRPASAEFEFEVMKNFELVPNVPSELTVGADGALYGTSQTSAQNGTIFRIDGTGTFTILHVFDAEREGYPTSNALTVGSDGALYGTTGSAYGPGTIYKINGSGNFTLVHTECADPGRLVLGRDGALYGICSLGIFRIDSQGSFTLLHARATPWVDFPRQDFLIAGSDGALYGTSRSVVFRIDPADGTITPIHSSTDDRALSGPLTVGSDGALYGTTLPHQIPFSGQYAFADGGTVFRVDSAGNFRTLHTFAWADGPLQDRVTAASDGTLYGTTGSTIFKIDSTGAFTSLHSFGSTNGPNSALTLGSDGAVYGTIPWGGVFRIDSAGNFTSVHSPGEPGWRGYLRQPLTLGSDGALYGTTECCYSGQMDSVFKIDRDGTFVSLHSFTTSADGETPRGQIVKGSDGAIYGTTEAGGAGNLGTLFRIDLARTFTTLRSFSGYSTPLVVGGDGALYGGEVHPCPECSSWATLFRLDSSGIFSEWVGPFVPAFLLLGSDGRLWGSSDQSVLRFDGAGTWESVHGFDYFNDGANPGPLTLGPDGAVYGITRSGGPWIYGGYVQNFGTIFRIDDAGAFSLLHYFDGNDGTGWSASALAAGDDGALYGTAPTDQGFWTLFRVDPRGNFATLHSFSGAGRLPFASLAAGADGAMYGVTEGDGSSDFGTIFRVDREGAFTVLHSFDGSDGAQPSASLLLGSDGALYGTTRRGGPSNSGTVFQIDGSGAFSTLHTFSGSDGGSPSTALIEQSDGSLYGTTPEGGTGGGGVVFRLFEHPRRQTLAFEPLPDRIFGGAPFTVSATASSGLPVSFSTDGSCVVSGDQVTLTGVGLCTVTASQDGDVNYQAAPAVSHSFHVLFDFTGFLRPVMNPPVVNRVKAGRTVPIRFDLGGDQGRDVLAAGSPSVQPVPCDLSAPFNDLEGFEFGHSSRLLHSPKRGTYTYLWKTDPRWAGTCQELSLELVDGSVHRALFQFLRPPRPRRGPLQFH